MSERTVNYLRLSRIRDLTGTPETTLKEACGCGKLAAVKVCGGDG